MNNVQATDRLMQIYQAEGEKMISGTEDSELMSAIDYALCALDQADRIRIRVTAEEKPTREDADKRGVVLAYYKTYEWEEIGYNYIAENPVEYPRWTCVPQLPEVTP